MARLPFTSPALQRLWSLVALAGLALSLAASLPGRPPASPPGVLLARSFGTVVPPESDARTSPIFRQRTREGERHRVEYGFLNFNSDPVELRFTIADAELEAYRRGYGVSRQDLQDLETWQRQALDLAMKHAVATGQSQAEYDAAAVTIRRDYLRRHNALFTERGLKFLDQTTFAPDIPQVVRRNIRPLSSLAGQIDRLAERRGYDSSEVIGAALSLVQTALGYHREAVEDGDRLTAGLTPPLLTLLKGKADCDSKTALLAALLLNWDGLKLIGVGLPGHYLMGMLGSPAKGDAYVEYQGLPYILVEPAGPAWLPPGAVADSTYALLDAGGDLAIEPLQPD